MKNNIIKYTLILFTLILPIYSESSNFIYPLRVESGGLYDMLRLGISQNESRDFNTFVKERNASIEGEIKFLNLISIQGGTGYTRLNETKMEPINNLDRYNIGFKLSKEFGTSNQNFLLGIGVRWFDRMNSKINTNENDPNLYLIKPTIFIGYKFNNFEIMTNFIFQSETNSSFKERNKEEFRRFYQFGISFSYKITDSSIGFLETEYRKPFETKLQNNQFWYIYPGYSFKFFEQNYLYISALISIKAENNNWDHGFKAGYYLIF